MPRATESIEYQIAALEKKLSSLKQSDKYYFSIKGKIAKLKVELHTAKQFEFLAR